MVALLPRLLRRMRNGVIYRFRFAPTSVMIPSCIGRLVWCRSWVARTLGIGGVLDVVVLAGGAIQAVVVTVRVVVGGNHP